MPGSKSNLEDKILGEPQQRAKIFLTYNEEFLVSEM